MSVPELYASKARRPAFPYESGWLAMTIRYSFSSRDFPLLRNSLLAIVVVAPLGSSQSVYHRRCLIEDEAVDLATKCSNAFCCEQHELLSRLIVPFDG
jgi:hypothetical protein